MYSGGAVHKGRHHFLGDWGSGKIGQKSDKGFPKGFTGKGQGKGVLNLELPLTIPLNLKFQIFKNKQISDI